MRMSELISSTGRKRADHRRSVGTGVVGGVGGTSSSLTLLGENRKGWSLLLALAAEASVTPPSPGAGALTQSQWAAPTSARVRASWLGNHRL